MIVINNTIAVFSYRYKNNFYLDTYKTLIKYDNKKVSQTIKETVRREILQKLANDTQKGKCLDTIWSFAKIEFGGNLKTL